MPENDMQDILAPENHKQGTLSKDRRVGQYHGNKAKEMEVAWACYQGRPRQHNTNCINVDTGQWKKEETSSTRNLEDNQGRNENNREDLEKLEMTATERDQWKSLVSALFATQV